MKTFACLVLLAVLMAGSASRFVRTTSFKSRDLPCTPELRSKSLWCERNGQLDDMISTEPIGQSRGICLDGQCYDTKTLTRWLKRHPSLPHNRKSFTVTQLNMLTGSFDEVEKHLVIGAFHDKQHHVDEQRQREEEWFAMHWQYDYDDGEDHALPVLSDEDEDETRRWKQALNKLLSVIGLSICVSVCLGGCAVFAVIYWFGAFFRSTFARNLGSILAVYQDDPKEHRDPLSIPCPNAQ